MDIKNLTLRDRAEKLAAALGLSIARLQAECGLSNAFFANVKKLTPQTAARIRKRIPNVNIEFLETGIGSPLLDVEETVAISSIQVPMLPISAVGGYLNDFETQIRDFDCEMVLSPIKGATLAMTVTGDSMSPEYPNGSRVLLKKINDKAFIEWGRAYVLDTENGAIVKNVHPCPDDDSCIMCRSINPNFEPFRVKKTAVRGWYKVLMQMALK
jgi:SOS-response transcriptional repressor LexA